MPTSSIPARTAGPLKGLSLQHRIPLLISLLLFIVVTLFIIISYWSIRKIESESGKQRLRSLAQQVSLMLTESIGDFIKNTKDIASSPSIKEYFTHPTTDNESLVRSQLNNFAGTNAHEYAYLTNAALQPVLLSQKNANLVTAIDSAQLPAIKDTSLVASNIYLIHQEIYFALLAPVKTDHVTKGYVVRCRQVKLANNVLKQYSMLAGQGISIIVGNRDGSVWTNLSQPLQYQLPATALKAGQVYQYNQEDQTILGAFQNIKNTPWIVVIEANRSLALQGSSLYLQWILFIAALVIIVVSVLAYYLGRNLTIPLKELIASVKALGAGDKTIRVPVHRTDEVGALAQAFNTMIQQLDATQLAMEKEMQASAALNDQLRRLSSHVNSVREEERSNIARDLHDQMGQVLTGFKMDLYLIKKRMLGTRDQMIDEKIKSIEAGLDEGVKFVRKLSSELRAGPLQDLGLTAAVRWYAENFSERYGISVSITSSPADVELPLPRATAIFRIFQEALTNVARHAKASHVDVNISQDKQHLIIKVTDNGRGFDSRSGKTPKTLGLLGMKERALMIDSRLYITSSPGMGCTIELSVPLAAGKKEIPV